MKKLLLVIAVIALAANVFSQSASALLVWNKSADDFNGAGTKYRAYVTRYSKVNGSFVEIKTTYDTKDTFCILSKTSSSYFFKYQVITIDSLGTTSDITDPVFVGKDTCFTITNKVYKPITDTVVKAIYKYTYDTIETTDTVIKTKFVTKYNITRDTVSYEYPTDTLTYSYTDIDISAEGTSNYYTIFVEAESGKIVANKYELWRGCWIAVTLDSFDNVIGTRKFILK